MSSMAYWGVISDANICLAMLWMMSLMLFVCSEMKSNILLLCIPSVNTSAHSV